MGKKGKPPDISNVSQTEVELDTFLAQFTKLVKLGRLDAALWDLGFSKRASGAQQRGADTSAAPVTRSKCTKEPAAQPVAEVKTASPISGWKI